ncbi:hypothetical protein [Thermomonas sp.]|uniref:hypothetical protein n=1 Tax=Thermomonas sp. TaxID=1971895 RepID=UPI002488B9CE|nr:hypothetical protein [Thermomonas sp.]MDI1254239.1 hypothetical protein [Thermomonas sp.]
MNTKFCTLSLSLLAGVCALAMPAVSHAAVGNGNVGYYTGCYSAGSAKAPLITQAGLTPVAVASLTASQLAPLGTLIIENCNGSDISSQINADVKAAVSAGMKLVIYDWEPGGGTAAALPGAPAATIQYGSGSQIDLAAGSPIVTGPGGTLTNASLDGGNSSNHGYATSIPVGSQAYLTTANPAQIVAFKYSSGAGSVVYSAIPFDCYLSGCNAGTAPGIKAYFVNVLSQSGFTTCVAEGFSGPKLILCKQVCEIPQSPARLTALIRAYIAVFRENPPCGR